MGHSTRLVGVAAAALLTPLAAASPTSRHTVAQRAEAPTVASSYFAGFHATTKLHSPAFTVEQIDWSKYSDIKWAFAETTECGDFDLSGSAPELIPSFVEAAHAHRKKASISIGGWTGSGYFSYNYGNAQNRTLFVQKCLELVSKYNLDGLDFDIEYPNRQGIGCNAINPDDTNNFLLFLQQLRGTDKGKNLLLTAAGSLYPWNDATGARSKDLGAFAEVLDYITIMGYDVYGAWAPTAGPNTPLNMACDPRNNQGGISEGVAQWMAAGIPAAKLSLGLGFYGHIFSVNNTSAFPNGAPPRGTLDPFPAQNSSNRLRGSSWDTDPPVDVCGNPQPPSGTYPIWGLVEQAKVLDKSLNPVAGMAYVLDSCSKTPSLYDPVKEIFYAYDNQESLTDKANYIKSTGMVGFTAYELGGDYNCIMVDTIRASLGMPL